MNTIIEEMLVNKVEERVGDGYSVRIRDVGKNNGVSRTAMEFTEKGDCMGTLVYLDEIFSEEPSEADVDRIADQIAEIGCQEKPVDQAGVKKFLNWDYARSRLVVRLVNAKWNSESLKNQFSSPEAISCTGRLQSGQTSSPSSFFSRSLSA